MFKGPLREEFEIIEIDIPLEEVLVRNDLGTIYPVDLRGDYFEMAKKWEEGQRIVAALAYAGSRYTPGMVLAFEGEVELLDVKVMQKINFMS